VHCCVNYKEGIIFFFFYSVNFHDSLIVNHEKLMNYAKSVNNKKTCSVPEIMHIFVDSNHYIYIVFQ